MTGELKGVHVLAIFGLCFSVIIGVNLTLAFNAVRSFPGLEVRNSYVASQGFDADRAAQEALGWTVAARADVAELVLTIADATGPVDPVVTSATLGRATHVQADQELRFIFDGTVHRAAITPLAPGNWNLRLAAVAPDGTPFRQRIVLRVAP